MIAGLFLAIMIAPADADEATPRTISCEGTYPQHLQGVAVGGESIYWSFTTRLVKTNQLGAIEHEIDVANHHGDLCFHNGQIYVAVNLGKFNDPKGNADSWVYVYNATTLDEVARHECQQVFHGAGGIGVNADHFFVVGGLPDGVPVNYVYEYDAEFQFIKKHILDSGHTLMGIQTATFANDRWWFGCYGKPANLLVADSQFQLLGRYEYNCALGIESTDHGHLLAAKGSCKKGSGCVGSIERVVPNENTGLGPALPSPE